MRAMLVLPFFTALVHNCADAQMPRMKQTWMMNRSTIIMPCNNSGFTDPASTAGFGIVDFDWSNSKAQWAKGLCRVHGP